MEYSSIRNYLVASSKDFYLIRHHDTFFAYDYDHNLLDQFRKKWTICLKISENDQIVYIAESYKPHIYIWNVFEKDIKKVRYTDDHVDVSNMKGCIDDGQELKILYEGKWVKGIRGYNYYISHFNKETLEYSTEFVTKGGSIFAYNMVNIRNQEVICFEKKRHDKEYNNSYLVTKKENKWETLLQTNSKTGPIFQVSQDGKYGLLASAAKTENDYGEIKVFDLSKFQGIDTIQFYHMELYRIIANFFEINNEAYIIFQAHPKPCDIYDTIWYTYVYSVSQEKIIYEKKFSFSLTYRRDIKLLIIEKNKARIESRFYKDFDESLGIDYIMKKLVTQK